MFRKITAEDNKYIETSKKYYKLINEFKSYLEEETLNSGLTKTGTSGKASSYARYLVRLIIIFQEYFPNEYVTFRSKEGSSKLNQLRELNGYKDYNKSEGRYPNAALNKFEEFKASYLKELESNDAQKTEVQNIQDILKNNDNDLLLLYGAKDETYNHAVVLRSFLEERLSQ